MAYPHTPGGSTPGRSDGVYYDSTYYTPEHISPSPTPSPHHTYFATPTPHVRPATRAHIRTTSAFGGWDLGREATPSPRCNSQGQYATLNVSSSRPSRRYSSSGARPGKHERRHSHSNHRASAHHGVTDEDELFATNGVYINVAPVRSKSRRHRRQGGCRRCDNTCAECDTDYYDNLQGGGYSTPARERDPHGFSSPRYEPPAQEPARRASHSRRNSTSVPQRPQTARPASSHHRKPSKKPAESTPRRATEEDAKRAKIPNGYSLKNWDPSERPILVLGSVFDANSLGKWIYDWTVYVHGASTPLSDVAGDLWLLLIQLSGKLRRSEEIFPRIRSKENKEMISDFIESGDRLSYKLKKLLKTCEAYMLKPKVKKDGGELNTSAGVAFIEAMFGAEREMYETETFMQHVRLWNLRFDANCEEILLQPTA